MLNPLNTDLQAKLANLNNIPLELQSLNQWVMWSYEDVGAAKPTKVPYQINGHGASVTNPNTWASFKAVCEAFAYGKFDGIGFVFTDSDKYFFLDLDETKGDWLALERQQKIFKEFDTYSERSPSGQGLHIIGIGKIPSGRKRSSIEIYSSLRYATFTGDVFAKKPLTNCQDLLTQLWAQMGASVPNTPMFTGDKDEKETDEKIITIASDAVNGEKFKDLFSGNWQSFYKSQSEADFALIDMLAFYTQNRKQIQRLFRTSGLGKRDKANRDDYVSWMINRSFDRMLPPIDLDGIKIAFEKHLEQRRVAQIVEPEAHNFQGVGASPTTPTNLGNNNDRNNQECNFTESQKFGRNKQERSKEASEEVLRKEQSLLYSESGKTPSENSNLVQGIQNNFDVQSMPGKPSSDTRLSSYEPGTERNEYSLDSSPSMVENQNNTRNEKMHSSVRKLPQEATLQSTKHIDLPPGLLGEIAQFIYTSAPRPVPEIALAGAIGLMAGIAGRSYNVSATGLNQYVLLIAQTGRGKEAISEGINKLINVVKQQVPTVVEFLGPDEIASGQALYKHLSTSASFVSILSEFGLRLMQMADADGGSPSTSLRRMFLQLYAKSGFTSMANASIYSDKDRNIAPIQSPSFSIIGESTPHRFYQNISEEMILEGLLPRFLTIEYDGPRPPANNGHDKVQPSFSLIEKLVTLAANSKTVQNASPRRVITVNFTDEARKMVEEFDKQCDVIINSVQTNHILIELWNRAHLKVLKLAATVAVGVNMYDPLIEANHVKWAMSLIQNDIETLSKRFESGQIGANTAEIKQVDELLRIIKDYLMNDFESIKNYIGKDQKAATLFENKVIPYAYISRRLIASSHFKADRLGSTNAIKRCLQILLDRDVIREMSKNELTQRFGTYQKSFVLHDFNILK